MIDFIRGVLQGAAVTLFVFSLTKLLLSLF